MLTDRLEDVGGEDLPISRLCFGHHFCQHLLPSTEEVEAAIRLAQERGWDFTLVVPFVTDRALEAVRAILDLVEDRLPGAEVVFNDWGVLMLLQGRRLTPVAGRTFCKSKRDPRLQVLFPDLPQPLQAYYRTTNVTGGRWGDFLKSYGVVRVEVDPPPWGLDVGLLSSAALPISLYVPAAYVTTTMNCVLQPLEDLWGRERCSRPCRQVSLEVQYPGLTEPLLVRGNTYFARVEPSTLPIGDLAEVPGLRLVYQGIGQGGRDLVVADQRATG